MCAGTVRAKAENAVSIAGTDLHGKSDSVMQARIAWKRILAAVSFSVWFSVMDGFQLPLRT